MAKRKDVVQDGKGRPSMLTQKRHQEICDAIALGAEMSDAAIVSGITKQTLYEYLGTARKVQGKQPNEISQHQRTCVALTVSIREAQAKWRRASEHRIDLAATIGRKMKKTQVTTRDGVTTIVETETDVAPDWRAAAWRLERRHPDMYGERREVEISGPGGLPVEIQFSDVVDRMRVLRERRGSLLDVPSITSGITETDDSVIPDDDG